MKDIKIQPPPVVTSLLGVRFSTAAWLIAITVLFFIIALAVTVASLVVAASEKATAKNNQITLEKIASFDNDKDTQISKLEQELFKAKKDYLRVYNENINYRQTFSVDNLAKVESTRLINELSAKVTALEQKNAALGIVLKNTENELKKLKNPVK